jgi:hypothetical protein
MPKDSDGRVFAAASQFFAALLGAGRVNETNQAGIVRYCVRAALQLAHEADQALAPQPEPQRAAAELEELDLEQELEELAKPEGTAYRTRPQGPPAGGRQGAPV